MEEEIFDKSSTYGSCDIYVYQDGSIILVTFVVEGDNFCILSGRNNVEQIHSALVPTFIPDKEYAELFIFTQTIVMMFHILRFMNTN